MQQNEFTHRSNDRLEENSMPEPSDPPLIQSITLIDEKSELQSSLICSKEMDIANVYFNGCGHTYVGNSFLFKSDSISKRMVQEMKIIMILRTL